MNTIKKSLLIATLIATSITPQLQASHIAPRISIKQIENFDAWPTVEHFFRYQRIETGEVKYFMFTSTIYGDMRIVTHHIVDEDNLEMIEWAKSDAFRVLFEYIETIEENK